MSQNDNNLLSFLKNQSLFNGSPTRKMSSRSRDRKSERNRSPGANQQFNGNQQYNASYNTGVGVNYNDNNRGGNNGNYQTGGNNGTFGQAQGGYNTQGGNYNSSTNYNTGTGYNNIQSGQVRSSIETTNQFNSSNDAINGGLLGTVAVLANQKTYASSFESARVETGQRLEGLAQKVKNEINNLNYKL